MGKYSGWLICSDYDNTLTMNGELVEENVVAIKRFRMQGGKFVVATGRTIFSALQFEPELFADGFVIVNNGNVLYDTERKIIDKMITLDENCVEVIKTVFEVGANYLEKFGIYYPEDSRYFISDKKVICLSDFDFNTDEITKLTFNCDTEEHTLMLMKKLQDIYGNKYMFTRAWPNCFEICHSQGGKAAMVKYVKDMLGIKKLICVGDYENDLHMLCEADISFAPSTAIESVRKTVTCVIENTPSGIFNRIVNYCDNIE